MLPRRLVQEVADSLRRRWDGGAQGRISGQGRTKVMVLTLRTISPAGLRGTAGRFCGSFGG